jgi:hypothetical protein
MVDDRPSDLRTAQKTPPQPAQDQPSHRPAHESRMQQKPDFGERSDRGRARLERRVAPATGADSGIGRAVVLALGRQGAEHEDAKETERWVKDAGRRALPLPGDVGGPEAAGAARRARPGVRFPRE